MRAGLSRFCVRIAALALAAASAPAWGAEARYTNSASPVYYCVDPDWPPFEVIDGDGAHVGVAADLLRLAAERAGVALQLYRTKDWDESLAASQSGRCQILSFVNQTPKRDAWLLFTDPIFTDNNVVITREDHSYIDNLAALSGEVLALPFGTSIEERVRKDFPNLKIITTDSESTAFALVSKKQADLTIRSLTVAVYTIKKEGWFNLKISGQAPGYENHLRIGVHKDHPELRDLLNKGVASISLAERAEIANKHVAIIVDSGLDYRLIGLIALFFAVIGLTSLFWALKLRRLNKKLMVLSNTDPLTGLANRAFLRHHLNHEYERYQRFKRDFTIVIVDFDHFKEINDRFGHPTGDAVLQSFAELMRLTARSQDVVGRWGGEEFLILCPETTAEQALFLAERLRGGVERHAFATGRRQTVSVGVAAMGPNEAIDDVIRRADQALYQAKSAGRNRVCVG